MRLSMLIGLVALTAGCVCSKGISTFSREPLIITGDLAFAPTFIAGGHRAKTLWLQNPNAVPVEVTVRVIAPFSARAETLRIAAGETSPLVITFAPVAATHFEATVSIIDDQHRVTEFISTGEGLATPPCASSTFCSPTHFDPEQERCVTTSLSDDTECTSSSSCFLKAVCASGDCIGTLSTCDDDDPCTTDVCEASGSCGHFDGSLSCPLPNSLCEAPICRPGSGCGSTFVEDGTPCGPRTCSDAKVCITGQCVSRSVPANQACLDVVAGTPSGCGFVDGQGESARLSSPVFLQMAFDVLGNLYFGDNSTIRRISPGGELRTIAGIPEEPGFVSGFGRSARFTNPEVLGFDRSGSLLIFEQQRKLAAPSSVTFAVRRMSPAGLVAPWVGKLDCPHASEGRGVEACLRFEGSDRGGATLEGTGQITIAGEQQVFRVSAKALVTSQPIQTADGGPLQLTGLMTSGDAGVWLCGSTRTQSEALTLLPSGHLVPRQGSCESRQIPNLGIVDMNGDQSVMRLPDGGFEVLVERGAPGAGVGFSPWGPPIAAQADGGYVVADPSRCLFLRGEGGKIRPFAGPVAVLGHVDGTRSRLLGAPHRMIASDDRLFFTDGEYVRALTGNQVVTLATPAPFKQPLELTLSPSGEQLAWPGEPVTVLHLAQGTLESVPGPVLRSDALYWASNGRLYIGDEHGLTTWEPDGGRAGSLPLHGYRFTRSRFSEGLLIDSRPGPWWATELSRFELDGGTTLLFTSREREIIQDFAEEPGGNVLFVEFFGTLVKRLRLDQSPPTVEIAFELSDEPSSIAVSPDGGIFIGVSSAILRAR